MTYDECLKFAWMWGFDFTLFIREDGTVETTSGWAGDKCIGHIFSDEQEALRAMMGIIHTSVLEYVNRVEKEKC